MPHNSSTGDELGSTDEVKVFKDEGDRDDEKLTENLLEEKSSLIDLTESEEKTVKNGTTRHDSAGPAPYGGSAGSASGTSVAGKLPHGAHPGFNMGYIVPPYSYPNGAAGGLPVSMANKMSLPPFFCHNADHLSSPPPAHCGILPYQLDPKTMSLTRPPLYSFPTSQYPYPMLSPDMLSVAPSWHTPSLYSPAAGFRTPYPSSLQIYPSLSSDFYRYSPTLLHSHPMLNPGHPAIITPGPKQDIGGGSAGGLHRDRGQSSTIKQESSSSSAGNDHEPSSGHHHRSSSSSSAAFHHHSHRSGGSLGAQDAQHQHNNNNSSHHTNHNHHGHHHHHNHHHHHHNNNNSGGGGGGGHKHMSLAEKEAALEKKRSHVKKPLNAFMLYMKEMRAKVVAECTLKESAAINQILGRKWHSLSREEQSVYYDKARQERQLHMELYPGWTARDNYGYGAKKKKRKKDRSPADPGGNSMKKCRARYGLDQQNQWCKPCRRKKKCIRYKEVSSDRGGDSGAGSDREGRDRDGSDDAIGSCGSMDDSKSPEEDDRESMNQSLSSPRCMSVLSSLQSPSTSIASPLNLLASPATPTNFYHHHDHLGLASMIATAQQQQQQLHQQLQHHHQQQQHQHQQHYLHHHHHQQAAAAAAAAAAALQNVSDKLNNISNDSGIGGSQLNNSYSNNFSPYNNHHTIRNTGSSAANGSNSSSNGVSATSLGKSPALLQPPTPSTPTLAPPTPSSLSSSSSSSSESSSSSASSSSTSLQIPPHLQQLNLKTSPPLLPNTPPSSGGSSVSSVPGSMTIKEELPDCSTGNGAGVSTVPASSTSPSAANFLLHPASHLTNHHLQHSPTDQRLSGSLHHPHLHSHPLLVPQLSHGDLSPKTGSLAVNGGSAVDQPSRSPPSAASAAPAPVSGASSGSNGAESTVVNGGSNRSSNTSSSQITSDR